METQKKGHVPYSGPGSALFLEEGLPWLNLEAHLDFIRGNCMSGVCVYVCVK